MCGILSIVNLNRATDSEKLIKASSVIRHRGPDDEGFMTWSPGEQPQIWSGNDTATSTRQHWGYPQLQPGQTFKVGFGHRRLSILDLSPAGHQPMVLASAGLAITYNGEVYNYLEIREELKSLGHHFHTGTDTEVILHAWAQWGVACLNRFNGMFAFVLLDHKNNTLYAVRDRFGVKPLYYYSTGKSLYLTSEIKQIKTADNYSLSLNKDAVYKYLAANAVDYSDTTFDVNIRHIPQGHYLKMDVSGDTLNYTLHEWYRLQPQKWAGSYEDAAARLKELLTDAVNVRLRSDVPVGSCLSGGLDSSAIVCLAAELLKKKGNNAGQDTVTACYDIARYDEWNFASEVVKQTGARSHRVFPAFKDLEAEYAQFIWHQDEPVTSTSMFSQWSVFKASKAAGLTVMVDGQGSDEQFAGYSGNDYSFYSGLLSNVKLAALIDETLSYKKTNGNWPVSALLHMAKKMMGVKLPTYHVQWLSPEQPESLHATHAGNLNENLRRQIQNAPLPALLRYEDRNSMAWNIESRTPFMDYRLIEFSMGLPDRFVYNRGTTKAILRTAMKDVIPAAISGRKDKMGFVTPEEIWMKNEGRQWFLDGINDTLSIFDGILLNKSATQAEVMGILDGKAAYSTIPWRLLCLGSWYNMVTNKK